MNNFFGRFGGLISAAFQAALYAVAFDYLLVTYFSEELGAYSFISSCILTVFAIAFTKYCGSHAIRSLSDGER